MRLSGSRNLAINGKENKRPPCGAAPLEIQDALPTRNRPHAPRAAAQCFPEGFFAERRRLRAAQRALEAI
jgi:hypothetical protein